MLTWDRLQTLGGISDERGRLTRAFGGTGMAAASTRLAEWMRAARLTVTTDDWGNLFARTPHPDYMPLLVIGSHFDTAPNAGKFDGALGILAAIGALESLSFDEIKKLPFAVEIAAFSDEEGSRFQTACLGSRAAVGGIVPADLKRTDAKGRTLASVIPPRSHQPEPRYEKGHLIAYWEAHIEQGPVLEKLSLPLAVVTGIAGQTRARLSFTGRSAHAGTCPMSLRCDALTGAAEFVLAVEKTARNTEGLVGTVGCLDVADPATNVVPAKATLSLDLRHLSNEIRRQALASLKSTAEQIAQERALALTWEVLQETPATVCDPAQMAILKKALATTQETVPELCSGATHDAAAMARVAPVAMLFVRCQGGLSHQSSEFTSPEDVAATVQTLATAIHLLGEQRIG
jgi:hydantoinase/carbamoylase family amidase